MTQATAKISFKAYYVLWEKAVKQSMKEMEYVHHTDVVRKGFLGLKKTYVKTPRTEFDSYWRHMSTYYPWNEIQGFKTVSEWNSRSDSDLGSTLDLSLKLLACTINRAKRWDEENEA